ncbi:MAG: hypothetical protein QN756_07185, partial [Nitrososphaeraceae archaeon]|nr:hypothetical protein [Nitrososphaeraceae archaeon]
DVTSIPARALPPQDKIVYKIFAPTVDNEDFDHYVVSAAGSSNPSGYNMPNEPTYQNDNNRTPEELYEECVRVAGKSFCDFLFKK